ncbi:endopeptidase [Alteribacter lacisalsi]|jgi:peptidoglycan hydrolase-like protein with peptidoglycan-binding domain|uniref:Endopeptidase n=1 Tax=Alteribacter lacisalsi TaxID=2045244 RepID=A0A2W0HEQ1_9BACI|nr:NlpC/P60 family protein [Alteribacter lacisalsi]PYZ95785.1 endopeptidase [Alteribacter lacisalsi]
MKKVIMSVVLAGGLFVAPTMADASMSMWDRGSDVKELQTTLNEEGFNSGTADGVFGPITRGAVQAYQLNNGISSPSGNFYGVAGPSTLSSLGLGGSSSSPTVAGVSTGSASGVIGTARGYIGSPYQWGGTSASGFDCSGFVQTVYAQHGKQLPRSVSQMWSATSPVSNPQAGDLVFFETRTGPSHVGIYIGNNEFIHSGASTGVTVTSMNNSYWSNAYLGARR